jgi:hypothetical protein
VRELSVEFDLDGNPLIDRRGSRLPRLLPLNAVALNHVRPTSHAEAILF